MKKYLLAFAVTAAASFAFAGDDKDKFSVDELENVDVESLVSAKEIETATEVMSALGILDLFDHGNGAGYRPPPPPGYRPRPPHRPPGNRPPPGYRPPPPGYRPPPPGYRPGPSGYVCYAEDYYGRRYAAIDESSSWAQYEAMRDCEWQSSGCFELGCRYR